LEKLCQELLILSENESFKTFFLLPNRLNKLVPFSLPKNHPSLY
jgi:hypothetical protein